MISELDDGDEQTGHIEMTGKSYFEQTRLLIQYALATEGQPGLRKSQIGALHAIGAHFTLHERPAVVVLPTGVGKTAVLMLAPYLLGATRALVITQSRFVRDQITRDYKALRTVRSADALPEDLPPPKIFENRNAIRSAEAWDALREFDVVISTPNGASPRHKDIPAPPDDLFDVVLIDEAHHSPAPTWNALLDAFPKAHAILFTATPFRRDRKEIKGKYIYTYPIQRAFEDGVFGDMSYLAVEPREQESPDAALAREADRVFREDQARGFSHVIMVRADSRPRADQLAEIYAQHTNLRLEVVHSGKSTGATEKIVKRLRDGELDGVICVDMLGEGFDLPNLKIAALHAPHRSLAVTLQFFGRFARVNGERLGDATFLAVPDEIGEDLDEIFRETGPWGKHIRMLGQARIGEEVEVREFLDEFEEVEVDDSPALEDLSLFSFTLFNHAKIFRVHGDVDLHAIPTLPGFRTEKIWVNEVHSTATFLVREEVRPKWATTAGLERVEHHLFVVYHDAKAGLLFVCATYREEPVYREVATIFVRGHVQPLSLSKINRVLRSFQDLELFNVGMRNRASGTVAESYRQMSGSGVHHAIDKDHGALYHRGHVFGRGRTANGVTTVGLSSLSKVWRLEHTQIPQLVGWCERLARDIENPAPFTTGIPLDHLDAGYDLCAFPDEVVLAADWHVETYRRTPTIRVTNSAGQSRSVPLLDLDLSIDRSRCGTDSVTIQVAAGGDTTRLVFSLSPFPSFVYADADQPRWEIERGIGRPIDLTTYLSDFPLRIHLADGSLIEGCQHFAAWNDEALLFDTERMQAVDWGEAHVDTEREFGACASPLRSIHDWLREYLVGGDSAVVFYDHRSGECADFLTVGTDDEGRATIQLYHCKGAGGKPSGDRVDDLYDVCGQATKSVRWRNKKRLVEHVKRRLRSGSEFVQGDLSTFLNLVDADPRHEFPLEIVAVQPGVSIQALKPKLATLLAGTNRGLVSVGCERLGVICSA